ncbi:hypothetical protein HMPREF3033_00106 [Veillonellaceae bacterium DNF00751]|nr:hypothetical protein HMPREF3033_00106 [Veillonellaceae bacterium DNF00751]
MVLKSCIYRIRNVSAKRIRSFFWKEEILAFSIFFRNNNA